MRRVRKPRVLYIGFYFPPSRASGVYRARATANFLATQDWDVTVFAAPMSFLTGKIGSLDERLLDTVDPRIDLVRPEFRQYAWSRDVRNFNWARRNLPVLSTRMHQWGLKHVFPEQYAQWMVACVRKAVAMHAKKRFDLVVATGNPFASFGAAWWISRLTGIPYVVDYRDSWTLNQFTEEPMFPEDHGAWAWEERILRDAALSVFVNEGMRSWHAQRYPKYADRMIVIENGWDPDVMPVASAAGDQAANASGVDAGSAESAADTPAADRPVRFAFLGTITTVQPLEELISAFEIARDHPDLAGAELNLHGYMGFFRGANVELEHRMGIDGGVCRNGVHYRGPVSKTEVMSVYESSDVLVFMTGGGKYVTAGKIYEYMASGRPIVSVHEPEIAATEILRKYPLWFTANSMDVSEIAHSMVAAGKAARDVTPDQRAAARAIADNYTRAAVLAPFEARLRQLIGTSRDRK
jgi:glycosyltransferase involved in cell wall biosynthesis